MATRVLPENPYLPDTPAALTAQTDDALALVRRILKPVASLKLTVVLFVLAICIIFFGTLAQVDNDIWVVIRQYFRTPIAWVDFSIFSSFFPQLRDAKGGFYFPGGWLIGAVMAVNLLAAHAVRFKVQSRGQRLGAGLVAIAAACGLTWLVIASGNNSGEVEGMASLEWPTLWLYIRIGLAGLFAAAVFCSAVMNWGNRLQWAVMLVVTAALGGLTAWALLRGSSAPDASSMRILWQLIKAETAGLALLGSSWIVFRKRAGIVLIHAGIGLMMFNELFVGVTAVESQMRLREGEAHNYSEDIRTVELAVIDPGVSKAATEDSVTVIPKSLLEEGQLIRDDRLPFDVEIVQFMQNSDLRDAEADDKNSATAGIGLRKIAVPRRPGAGTDTDSHIDLTSAYVKLLKKGTSEPLGTWLVGVEIEKPDQVEVDGRKYDLALRFKRIYKPYAVRLDEGRKDDYLGTNTPRNYSSDIHLIDPAHNVDRKVHIWMNNPLRYAGETFYQSGFAQIPDTDIKISTLSVVSNAGWMIPYVACMIVATGLLAHFLTVLVRFLQRQARGDVATARDDRETPLDAVLQAETLPPDNSSGRGIVSAIETAVWILVVSMFGYVLAKAIPPRIPADEMNLYAFGELPLMYEGRIKPFDTLARNALRAVSDKQTYLDNDGESHSAVEWMLDVVNRPDKAEEYKVFRIENLDLLQALKLPHREGLRYSLAEITADPRFELPKDWTTGKASEQRQAAFEVHDGSQAVEITIVALPATAGNLTANVNRWRKQIGLAEVTDKEAAAAAKSITIDGAKASYVELVGPDGAKSRESILGVLAARGDQVWFVKLKGDSELADREKPKFEAFLHSLNFGVFDEFERQVDLAKGAESHSRTVYQKKVLELAQRMDLYRVLQKSFEMLPFPTMPTKEEMDQDQQAAFNTAMEIRRLWQEVMPKYHAKLAEAQVPLLVPVDKDSGTWQPLAVALDLAYVDIYIEGKDPNPKTLAWTTIFKAYRDGNAADFNTAVDKYAAKLDSSPPVPLDPSKVQFEAFFNHFEPFYYAAVLYLMAFVLGTIGFLASTFGWGAPFRRAAFGLMVATFALHTFALVARIYISGRPPVTNLYSSAVFIGWGAVVSALVFEGVFRIGIGNVLGGLVGFATLLISHYLATSGDTFTVLQAVLDTQFWLATHVVCITLGYTATLVAGTLGLLYVIFGVCTPVLGRQLSANQIRAVRFAAIGWAGGLAPARAGSLAKELPRMIYGTLCFAIFFSFVGTVLGGLWADDSWGRFWGWDPKENGALIIVVWNALVLHARWDGWVKDRGLALLAIGGNIAVSWSWFGVNELGAGLHSYGFTEGVAAALAIFMASQLVIIAAGSLPKRLWWSFRAES